MCEYPTQAGGELAATAQKVRAGTAGFSAGVCSMDMAGFNVSHNGLLPRAPRRATSPCARFTMPPWARSAAIDRVVPGWTGRPIMTSWGASRRATGEPSRPWCAATPGGRTASQGGSPATTHSPRRSSRTRSCAFGSMRRAGGRRLRSAPGSTASSSISAFTRSAAPSDLPLAAAGDLADPHADAEAALEARERKRALAAAIEALSARQAPRDLASPNQEGLCQS